jgi:hypothetical protein
MDGEPGSHLPALFPEESVSIRDILVDLGSDGLDGDGIGRFPAPDLLTALGSHTMHPDC